MYDGLWESENGTTSWFDGAPDDQREWLEGLADKIIDRGSEPIWRQVGDAFRSTFGVDKPVDSTISDTIRRLVRQRAG